MTDTDDRQKYLENRAQKSLGLGIDEGLFQRSKDLIYDLDKYDYSYLLTWMGVPIIQFPADIMATQNA